MRALVNDVSITSWNEIRWNFFKVSHLSFSPFLFLGAFKRVSSSIKHQMCFIPFVFDQLVISVTV